MKIVAAQILIVAIALPLSAHPVKKTLARIEDPVVMECKDMEPLWGSPIDELSLMVLNNNSWVPIPFQIDQKKPDGMYAFTLGPEAIADPDPNLDANDELVFMVKESGDRAVKGSLPGGGKTIMEIEIVDPENNQKGWVYLARFSGSAPRSPDDYIKLFIDKDKNRRGVSTYEYIGSSPLDRVSIDYLAAQTTSAGEKGENTLDRLKIRGKLIFPGWMSFPIKADEMMKAEDLAYIDGPVRVLQLSKGYLAFGFIKIKGTGYMLSEYYVNHINFPVYMKSPNLPGFLKGLVPGFRLRAFLDFNPNIKGSHSFSAANPFNEDVVLDGKMSTAEKNLDTKTPIDWIAGSGPQGAIVSRLIMGGELGGSIKMTTYYMDDNMVADPPESYKGVQGVGFLLEGDKYFPEYSFRSIAYFKKELKPEDVKGILDILDHPLKFKVTRVN